MTQGGVGAADSGQGVNGTRSCQSRSEDLNRTPAAKPAWGKRAELPGHTMLPEDSFMPARCSNATKLDFPGEKLWRERRERTLWTCLPWRKPRGLRLEEPLNP